LLAEESASSIAGQLKQIQLDSSACFRVRDLDVLRDEAHIYFTDGYLLFAEPVDGRRILVIYSGNEPGADAEVLLRPPDRSERASLARATESPTLDEHFNSALLIFTDGTGDEIWKTLHERGAKANPEKGLLLAENMVGVARNLTTSFQVRMVQDLLSGNREQGLFYGAFAGATLGNFDLIVDPTMPEQIVLGKVSDKRPGSFDIWTSFQTRSRRQEPKPPAQDAVVMTDYRIQATLQTDLVLSAVTRITAKARSRAKGAIMFELSPAMEVASVKVDGAPAEVFRKESMRSNMIRGWENEPFIVCLPVPFEAGTTHEIEIEHSGKVVKSAGNNVYFVTSRSNWYPAHGYEFTNFDLTFRVPAALRVVATGDIAEEKIEGDWRIARRRTSAPVRFAGFNVGTYEGVEIARGGYQVQVFGNRSVEPALVKSKPEPIIMPPSWEPRITVHRTGEMVNNPAPAPDPKARLSILAAEISASLEWMTAQFGPPPLKTLTASPIPGYFGQGFPGLLYLSTISFLSDKDRPANLRTPSQTTFYSEILQAHETAHQWWGNLVISAGYRDDWVQEALANYSALMLMEKKKGAKALEFAMDEYRTELKKKVGDGTIEATGPITWGVRLRSDAGIDPWRVITYDKGSWIIHMLRRRMGDAQFLKMLAETRKRYAYKTLTTEQFRELAAEFTPPGSPDRTLESFFSNWVYSTGIPTLEVKAAVKGRAPDVQLSVTVTQTDVGEEFSVDVPVEIRVPNQTKPIVKWVHTGPEPAGFTVALKAPPSKTELAPGFGVLAVRK
jgi:hypothetical protein